MLLPASLLKPCLPQELNILAQNGNMAFHNEQAQQGSEDVGAPPRPILVLDGTDLRAAS